MSHNVREQFQQLRAPLAEFRDQNINRATARAQTELERLQNESDLAFNVYNSLAQQVEQAKLKVQEQTPVESVLQPVQVPVDDETSGLMVLIVFVMLSGFAGLGWIFVIYFMTRNSWNREGD